eukprot:9289392-Pyramimonas_sp.AAC.1
MSRAPRPSQSVPERSENVPERSGTDVSSSWPRPKCSVPCVGRRSTTPSETPPRHGEHESYADLRPLAAPGLPRKWPTETPPARPTEVPQAASDTAPRSPEGLESPRRPE